MLPDTCTSCGERWLETASISTCPGCGASVGGRQESLALVSRGPSAADRRSSKLALTPEFLARYRIENMIGSGAMGMVFAAVQRSTERPVAVKFLLRVGDPELRERFEREGRLLARIPHPNVVKVLDVGSVDEHPYLVMELLAGFTLRHLLITEGRLVPAEAARISGEILEGLEACHQAGAIHRDLKPENVMFDEHQTAKLVDLGLARCGTAGQPLTHTGALMGTPAYMAPEQARGEEVGPAGDLYAAGAMLFEMLAGRPPHAARSLPEMLELKLEGPVPDLARVAPEVAPELASLVTRALAHRPEDRPASAAAMRDELARAVRIKRPGVARARGVQDRTGAGGRLARRTHLLPPLVAPGLLAVLVALEVLLASTSHRTRPAAAGTSPASAPVAPAIRPRLPLLGDGGAPLPPRALGRVTPVFGQHGWLWAISATPDGRWIATFSHLGQVRLWSSTSRRLEAAWRVEGTVDRLEVTPDGHAVVSIVRGLDGSWSRSAVVIQPVAGAASRIALPAGTERARLSRGGAFAGSYNAATRQLEVRAVPPSGNPTLLPVTGRPLGLALAPDGSSAVVVMDDRVEVWDVNAARRQRTTPLGAARGASGPAEVSLSADGRRVAVQREDVIEVHDLVDLKRLVEVKLPHLTESRISLDGGSLTALHAGLLDTLDLATHGKLVSSRRLRVFTFEPLAGPGAPLVLAARDGFQLPGSTTIAALHVDPRARYALLHVSGRGAAVWDRASGTERPVPGEPLPWPNLHSSTPDGSRVLVRHALPDGVWNGLTEVDLERATGRKLPRRPPHLALLDRPGSYLAVTEGGALELWAADGSKRVVNASVSPLTVKGVMNPGIIAVDPAARWALLTYRSTDLVLANLRTGELRKLPEVILRRLDERGVRAGPAACFLEGGRFLVCEATQGQLHVIDCETLAPGIRLRGPAQSITALVASADERYLVAGLEDGSLQGWSLPTGRSLGRIPGGISPIVQLGIDPDQRLVLALDLDGVLTAWEAPLEETSN